MTRHPNAVPPNLHEERLSTKPAAVAARRALRRRSERGLSEAEAEAYATHVIRYTEYVERHVSSVREEDDVPERLDVRHGIRGHEVYGGGSRVLLDLERALTVDATLGILDAIETDEEQQWDRLVRAATRYGEDYDVEALRFLREAGGTPEDGVKLIADVAFVTDGGMHVKPRGGRRSKLGRQNPGHIHSTKTSNAAMVKRMMAPYDSREEVK